MNRWEKSVDTVERPLENRVFDNICWAFFAKVISNSFFNWITPLTKQLNSGHDLGKLWKKELRCCESYWYKHRVENDYLLLIWDKNSNSRNEIKNSKKVMLIEIYERYQIVHSVKLRRIGIYIKHIYHTKAFKHLRNHNSNTSLFLKMLYIFF